jgi:hypothetical protein
MRDKLAVLGITVVGGVFVLALILIVGVLFVFTAKPSGEGVTVVLPSVEFSDDGPRERVRGSGNVVTEDVLVRNFDRVSLTGIGDAIITQGETESLRIETDDNILPYIETEVRNGTLVIGLTDAAWGKNLRPTTLQFHVGMKEVTGLDISGAGGISAAALEVERLRVDIGGAGDIDVDTLEAVELSVGISGAGSLNVGTLNAEESSVSINGAGDVNLAGQVEQQDIRVNGAGNYRADELESQTANVELNGTGSVTIWVAESLDVRIAGVGNVSYYGDPSVDSFLPGIGRLFRLGDR